MPHPKAKDTLLSYLRVQEDHDRRLISILRKANTDIDRRLKTILGNNIGDVIRREQLVAVQKELHLKIADLFQKEGLNILASQERASAAATKTFQTYEQMLFTATGVQDDARIQAYLRSARQTAKAGIASAEQRIMGTSYIPLSDQVYKTTQLSTGMVDRLVASSLAQGLNARELALAVSHMIRPDVRGGISYASMRLGRTEINNAFHAVSVRKYQTTPWVETVKWNLSGSHPEPDECNSFAEDVHFDGGEPGQFEPGQVPIKPHPHCLCFTTPETVEEDQFLDNFFAGVYDDFIDGVIARS